MGTIVEHQTYFGPRDTPLFGALAVPEHLHVTGGVVLCGSLGKEAMDSARFERVLARALANRGLAVLRFDYLGTGDSAGDQLDDHAVDGWRRSVQHAVDYLLSIGAPSLSVVALRAGSLIVDDALANADLPVDQLVHIDPASTGRRYLREQAALFQVAVGEDSTHSGLSIIGAQFTRHAADEFSRFALGTGSRTVADQLAVVRSGETDRKIVEYVGLDGVTALHTHGLPEFAEPAELVVPMPLHIVEPVAAWLHDRQPTRTVKLEPRYQASAVMSVDTRFGQRTVVETIERIEPHDLFAIRSRPAFDGNPDPQVVLFCGTSNDSHFGSTRQWVELSRILAAGGVEAVRWDRPSLGESGPISDSQWLPIVTMDGVPAALAAARHAAKDSRRLHVVGLCSGAWYAAHIGRTLGAKSVVMINTMSWNWWSTLDWRRERLERTALMAKIEREAAAPSPQPPKSTRALAIRKIRGTLKAATRFRSPRLIRRAMATVGAAQSPEVVLSALAKAGTTAAVILCKKDTTLFDGTGGRSAIDRLKDAPSPPMLIAPAPGDHPAYHGAIREVIENTVIDLAISGVSSPNSQTLADSCSANQLQP